MRILCMSDTHGLHALTSKWWHKEVDVLVHAGDFTSLDHDELDHFTEWLKIVPAHYKLIVAGNHEEQLEKHNKYTIRDKYFKNIPGVRYLEDDGENIDGVQFYGSPWQPAFFDWAYNLPRNGPELAEKWAAIPDSTDVLITHGPPIVPPLDRNFYGQSCGCELLTERVKVVKPKYHIFGHIHPGYGMVEQDGTTYINCSILDERYMLKNEPVVIEMEATDAADS